MLFDSYDGDVLRRAIQAGATIIADDPYPDRCGDCKAQSCTEDCNSDTGERDTLRSIPIFDTLPSPAPEVLS